MELQRKLKDYFKKNGLQMMWFAEKIGMSKQQLYQIVGGHVPVPSKYWATIIKMTNGEVSLRDIVEYNYKEIKEIEFKDVGKKSACEMSLKDFNK